MQLPDSRRAILLVEDERVLRQVLALVLNDAGYDVTPCMDGLEALRLIQCGDRSFDLVISDVGLPGLRGDKLAAEVRRTHPALPILLMTGFSNVVIPKNAEALGVAGVLEKPIAIEDLLNAVDDALRTVTCRTLIPGVPDDTIR